MNISTTAPVDCTNPKNVFLDIHSPIPSFATSIIGVYFLPIIIIFGIVGNIISLIILSQAAKKISSHFYLWWMAVFDVISLVSFMPSFWAVMLVRPYYQHIYGERYPATWIEYGLVGNYVCQAKMFFTFTARTCSIYTIVFVTVERFIMVVFPMHRARLCTLFSAKLSIGILIVVASLINLPWIFALKALPSPCLPLGVCVGSEFMIITTLVDFIILCLVPCIIIIICNVSIIFTLRGRLRMNLLVNVHDARKQEKDITIRLLAVSFAFFFLTIPSLVIVSIQTVQELQHNMVYLETAESDTFVISIILFAINLAINFIIYCFTGKIFRTAALALVKCNWTAMKKYRDHLVTDSTAVPATERITMQSTATNLTRRPEGDSLNNRDSFQQKRGLIKSNV